jgi:hypothetical protein
MEHVDGPINEEFITEVDELFALSGNYSVLGEELAHVSGHGNHVGAYVFFPLVDLFSLFVGTRSEAICCFSVRLARSTASH